ncbi:MAG: hypothetical protein A3I77_08125 [Gammaproteobacteria bacterium RIFCSPLOWO2_02_FULL_42_14]|nr:MAG: hypothetical protein A3B71_03960 [Gammaproteobacteria bacterium RIFCSPHIGHO2_02_FULL_42_43]OGT52926.1 MAG: hypothetical protein A3E54_07565 [Gammaproteobacteria bacterium RIFCSPHIGHO2_12_FULL_41_25]OGT61300.1 MAG: hypothetical protein A3I77_08125 [Gammaproteobacteria bacterium RIFCSPLOWO2_02_FULL_42_14]OGT87229.1 MAG: hypothetical protein A3G86_01850 [Gammaproteobacteria bacterium RIFCSPLOWO2_12_FULL_42_18]
MPVTTANNISIYYEQQGRAGEQIILLGGLTADHQVWNSIVRLLSPHFRLLVLDNRGAGQTDSPDYPYTTSMMAKDTVALMETLKISRAHFIGHSMGGCIAQQIALTAPEKINKMVLACSRTEPSTLSEMILSMRAKLQALGITEDVLAEYTMPFLFSENFLKDVVKIKGFIQWTLRNSHPQTASGYRNQLHAVQTHNITHQLSQIKAPTLVIAGSDDVLMPVKYAKSIADAIPRSQFSIIPDCAHMPHVEKSAEFVELVKKFL